MTFYFDFWPPGKCWSRVPKHVIERLLKEREKTKIGESQRPRLRERERMRMRDRGREGWEKKLREKRGKTSKVRSRGTEIKRNPLW